MSLHIIIIIIIIIIIPPPHPSSSVAFWPLSWPWLPLFKPELKNVLLRMVNPHANLT
jgi:hypothetical protein